MNWATQASVRIAAFEKVVEELVEEVAADGAGRAISCGRADIGMDTALTSRSVG
ncbi:MULTISPECIES: hypothetical protein [unclassified Frankia]|nr:MULTISPECIES: hypothetical protein [unclassified Frankia]